MGNARCFHDMNPSGSISFPHISCCFTAFSCLGWEWASSCSQLGREKYFISRLQLSGQMRRAAARSAPGCWPTVGRDRTHSSGSAGTKRGQSAPAAMMALLVAQGNCSGLGSKGSEPSVVPEVTCERADSPVPAGARLQAHPILSSCSSNSGCAFILTSCPTPVAPSTPWVAKRLNRPKKLPLINAISHFLHSI